MLPRPHPGQLRLRNCHARLAKSGKKATSLLQHEREFKTLDRDIQRRLVLQRTPGRHAGPGKQAHDQRRDQEP